VITHQRAAATAESLFVTPDSALPADRQATPADDAVARAARTLRVEEVVTPEAFAALAPEWTALAAAHGAGLPFRTWEWNEAWWRWFPEKSHRVRDQLFLRTFRAPGGELVGVAPLILVRRPGDGPALVRGLEFFGTDHYVTELRGVIAHPAWRDATHRALLANLRGCAKRWDWIRWRGLPVGSDAEAQVRASGQTEPIRKVPAYHLPLPASWEEFRASRPRNVKESLRKCYNSLERDGHAFELLVARTPAAVRDGVERFLTLHEARARAEGFKAHQNVFSGPASRGFLLDVSARLAARDAMRVFQLRVGDGVVAVRVGFALGDTLYLYFSGYDPAWAHYSVMTTTVAESIRYAIGQGFARVHLSTGSDESKLRWRPECEATVEVEQRGTGLRATIVHRVSAAAASGPAQRLARALLARRREA
jgi:CelD/BcsL family acetyltransferase involved in cellulose biosynthesis